MNFILLGYIIAWIAVIWVTAVIAFTINEYSKLTPKQKEVLSRNGIDATKHLAVLILSIVYIVVYHVS